MSIICRILWAGVMVLFGGIRGVTECLKAEREVKKALRRHLILYTEL